MSWAKVKNKCRSLYEKYLIQPFETFNRRLSRAALVFLIAMLGIVFLRFIGARAFFRPNGDLVFEGLWPLADYVEYGIWAMPFVLTTFNLLLITWGSSVFVGQVKLLIGKFRERKKSKESLDEEQIEE